MRNGFLVHPAQQVCPNGYGADGDVMAYDFDFLTADEVGTRSPSNSITDVRLGIRHDAAVIIRAANPADKDIAAWLKDVRALEQECPTSRGGRALLEAATDLLDVPWNELVCTPALTYYGCYDCCFSTGLATDSAQFRAEEHALETGHRIDVWVLGDTPRFDDPLTADERDQLETRR